MPHNTHDLATYLSRFRNDYYIGFQQSLLSHIATLQTPKENKHRCVPVTNLRPRKLPATQKTESVEAASEDF